MNGNLPLDMQYEALFNRLTDRHEKGKAVSMCMEQGCHMHHINGDWMDYPPWYGYQSWSHTLCPGHLDYYLNHREAEGK